MKKLLLAGMLAVSLSACNTDSDKSSKRETPTDLGIVEGRVSTTSTTVPLGTALQQQVGPGYEVIYNPSTDTYTVEPVPQNRSNPACHETTFEDGTTAIVRGTDNGWVQCTDTDLGA